MHAVRTPEGRTRATLQCRLDIVHGGVSIQQESPLPEEHVQLRISVPLYRVSVKFLPGYHFLCSQT